MKKIIFVLMVAGLVSCEVEHVNPQIPDLGSQGRGITDTTHHERPK